MRCTARDRWRRWQVRIVIVLCLGAAMPSAAAAASPTAGEFERCLLDRINQERVAAGRQELEMGWDRVFGVRNWSKWMRYNTFRHMTSAERNSLLPPGTSTWAENIAMHSAQLGDCEAIHDMFMSSSGHRANRLSSNARYAALGAYHDASGWWVTELFFTASGYPAAPEPQSCSGSSCDTIGFQDSAGRFQIRGQLTTLGANSSSFFFGNPGDVAFSGDWDCDGSETLGLYRRSDGFVYLRNSNTQGVADTSFYFGNPGDLPVAGDFDGDGCDTVSIYRPSEARFYVINKLGSNGGGLGASDFSFAFGDRGDQPFVGDFDGDGVDTIGLHRESTGLVYFRNSNTTGVAHSQFVYGNRGDRLVAGDWDGDGKDSVAVYRPSNGMVYLKRNNGTGPADWQFFADLQTGMVAINP